MILVFFDWIGGKLEIFRTDESVYKSEVALSNTSLSIYDDILYFTTTKDIFMELPLLNNWKPKIVGIRVRRYIRSSINKTMITLSAKGRLSCSSFSKNLAVVSKKIIY